MSSLKVYEGKVRITVDEELCKGCEICVEMCPRGVLALSKRINSRGYHPAEVVDPDACVKCWMCVMLCPDFAIDVE